MKLYFKDLSYETKYKWLEYYLNMDRLISSSRLYDEITKDFERGYIELDDYLDEYHDELKALNIWKEPRKFGRFWDKSKKDCEYGFMEKTLSGDRYIYHCINEYGEEINSCKHFEEITDLKELQ